MSMPNPALFLDDAMDAYLLYKRNQDQQRKRAQRAQRGKGSNKTASLGGMLAKGVSDTGKQIGGYLISPEAIALAGGGLLASMYGPQWAYGPSEEEIDRGKRFDKKRALKSLATWLTVGGSISRIPTNAVSIVQKDTPLLDKGLAVIGLGAGVPAAFALGKDIRAQKEIDMDKVKGSYSTLGKFELGAKASHSAINGFLNGIREGMRYYGYVPKF